MSNIPVLRPTADEQTIQELVEMIRSGWWGQGPKVKELEEEFARQAGAKYAIATNSCTAALDLCLKAYEITRGRLVTTPMTFVADAIVGEWNGLSVEFADINVNTLCLEPDNWFNPDVIVAVNSHGRLADINEMRKRNPNSLIVEDCAHCVPDGLAGTRGDIAVWSFQAVKVIPGGDGGMITTDDEEIARKLRNMSWLGVEKSTYSRTLGKQYSWDYDILHGGTKSYMNDINAVLILGNLRRKDALVEKRLKIQARYNAELGDLPVSFFQDSPTCQYYTLAITTDIRNTLSERLAEKGITTSVHFKPLSEMTYWKKAIVRDLSVTDKIWPYLLSLPCHDALTDDEQTHIIQSFKEAIQ